MPLPTTWTAKPSPGLDWCHRCRTHRIEGNANLCPSCQDDDLDKLLANTKDPR